MTDDLDTTGASTKESANDAERPERPLAEVVRLPAGPTLRTGCSRKKHSPCMHRATIVDYAARTVECATCGGDLDPIRVLTSLARAGDEFAHMQQQKKKLGSECAALEDDIKRLRSKRRRLREDLHRVGIGVRMVIAVEIERSLGWVAGKRGDQITAVLAKLVSTIRNYDVSDVVDAVDKASADKAG